MNERNPIPEASLEEAMDWLILLKERRDCRDTEAALQHWLASSDMNGRAWKQALKTWALLGETAPAFAGRWARPQAPAPRPRSPFYRRAALGGLVALAALAILFIAGPGLLIRLEADYVTTTGEKRTVTLSDGTVIDLGGDSALAVSMSGGDRHVDLLSGEAFFDVAHDAARPFTVDAGGASISVLGTAFDMQLSTAETRVALARGAVAVSHPGPAQRNSFEMAPGDMASIDRETGLAQKRRIDIEEIGAWRQGKLYVNDLPLADVVERIQRYHAAFITIADPSLGRARVTGLYDLRNPEKALEALVEPFGAKARGVTPYVTVLSRF